MVPGFFNIETVIWLFPIIFMFHDLEEIITVEGFMNKYKYKTPKTLLARLVLRVNKRLGVECTQVSIAVAWILLIISFITIMTANLLPMAGNFFLFTAALNVFFLQAFIHIGKTIILHGYTPGIITAIFFVIPYSLLTYYSLFQLNLIDGHSIFKSIPISILMVPIFLIGNLLGRRLSPLIKHV